MATRRTNLFVVTYFVYSFFTGLGRSGLQFWRTLRVTGELRVGGDGLRVVRVVKISARDISKGRHRRRPQKIAKNWLPLPPLSEKWPHRLNPLSVRADTLQILKNPRSFVPKVRTSSSEEPPFLLVRKISALDKLPPDFGRLLWTASNQKHNNIFLIHSKNQFPILCNQPSGTTYYS